MPTKPVRVAFDQLDYTHQARIQPNEAMIQDYARRWKDGSVPPPVHAMRVSDAPRDKPWLTDGNHRIAAAKLLGKTDILAVLTDGTRKEALAAMARLNRSHGVPLTKDDRDNLIRQLLECDPAEIDSVIGRMVGVSAQTVLNYRPHVPGAKEAVRRRGKGSYTPSGPRLSKVSPESPAGKLIAAIRRLRGEIVSRLGTDLRRIPRLSGADVEALSGLYQKLETWLKPADTAPSPKSETAVPVPPPPRPTAGGAAPETGEVRSATQIAQEITETKQPYFADTWRKADTVRCKGSGLGWIFTVTQDGARWRVDWTGRRSQKRTARAA